MRTQKLPAALTADANRIYTACAGVAVMMMAASVSSAADWPQWRGPNRDGISKETGLMKEWPQEGPKLLWQVTDLGEGYSTPAIAGGRLYVLSNKGNDNEFIQARDVADGKEIWTTRLGKVGNPNQQPNYAAARSTPTVEGDVVYALGSDGDLACLEIDKGTVRWQKIRIAPALPSTDNQSAERTEFRSRRFVMANAGDRPCNFVCKLGAAARSVPIMNQRSGESLTRIRPAQSHLRAS